MKIEVRPIEVKKWHKKIGKEDFTCPKRIRALVNENMEYSTGLNYYDKNFTDPDTDEQITEAKYYSKLLNQDLSARFDPDNPHPFWDASMSSVKLENAPMFFETKNPLDYVRVKMLKACKFIANSVKEYEEGKFPDATHVIFDESEEIEAKAAKIEIKNQVITEVNKLDKEKKNKTGIDYCR